MKASTKTVLYVLGGAAVLVGGGTAVYFATRPSTTATPTAPPAPMIPVSNTQSATPTPATPPLTQADIQKNATPPPPPPAPPTIQKLKNLSNII